MNRPTLTRELASEICSDRIRAMEEGDVPSLEALAFELAQAGTLPRVMSRVTLSRLFNGHTYPDLKDLEGRPIIWANMPSAVRAPERGYTLATHQTAICQLQRQMAVLQNENRSLKASLAGLQSGHLQ